jgi:hypothetical protein
LETRKFCELTAVPSGVVTVIAPVFAPEGTFTVIFVSVGDVGTTDAPLPNLTEVAPASPEPAIVTSVPTGPEVGEIDVIVGPAVVVVTVKLLALVPAPAEVVTEIGPLVAPAGTVAVTCESLTTENDAAVPLNFTKLAPVKLAPVTVTDVPAAPLAGENDEIVGAAATVDTVKLAVLVPVPPALVTEIGPVVAPVGTVAVTCVSLLMVNVAAVPLNFTEVAPVKPVPVTVTDDPTAPLAGENPLTVGAACVEDEQPGSWNDAIRVSQSSSALVVGCAS